MHRALMRISLVQVIIFNVVIFITLKIYIYISFTNFTLWFERLCLYFNSCPNYWLVWAMLNFLHLLNTFLGGTIQILGRASLCSQNSLSSLWHGFWTMTWIQHAISVSGALSCCKSVLPHSKGVHLNLDLAIGKATEEHLMSLLPC